MQLDYERFFSFRLHGFLQSAVLENS